MSVDSTVVPYVIEADQSYTQVEITTIPVSGVYGSTVVNNAPSSPSSGVVTFTGTVNIDLEEGNTVVQFISRNYNPATILWIALSSHNVGDRLVDDNGYVQEALIVTGPSGATKPVTFTVAGEANDVNLDITGIAISNSILTVTAANSLTVGQVLYLYDLQVATFLNGVTVTVTSATGSAFTASYSYGSPGNPATYPPTLDSGLAGIVTQDGGVTWVNQGLYEVSPIVRFTIIPFISGSSAVIGPPSAINAYKSQVACRVEWLMPAFAGTVGTKVMLSTDSAGVNPPYVQYGDVVPVTAVSRVSTQTLSSVTNTSYDPETGKQVITTTNQTQEFTYNYVDIPPSAVSNANQFYALLSTVVQDPVTNALFESQQNGPILCGFVNLHLVSPTDFLALQRKEDIAGRLITNMTTLYPDLDLSPRSELRDLLIDPVAIELSNMSVREWFDRCSASVSAMSQIDNANGNGISDPFNTSSIKQQIARAFGLSASDTQTLVNNQFDVLGESVGLTRGGATGSVVTLTFYTYVKPTQQTNFNIGTICSTFADSTTAALTFTTTGSAVVTPNSAASFYDQNNGWWAVSVPASCQTTGSATNVGAGTISTVSSGAPSGWNVTNLVPAVFGQDDEINSKFASRIATRQIVGVDSGTRNGYLTSALGTPGIVAATVVAAGDIEMLRDWDNIRQKHVFGCVDVYVQGVSSSQNDDTVAFSYQNSSDPTSIAQAFTTWLQVAPTAPNSLIFQQVNNPQGLTTFNQLPWPLYQVVFLVISGISGTFFLGVDRSQINTRTGVISLNPNDVSYTVPALFSHPPDTVGQVRVPYLTNQQVMNAAPTNVKYYLLARLQSPLVDVPSKQPVLNINSVVGQPTFTGTVPEDLLDLVHTSDFLLYGGSNQAGDEVQVASTSLEVLPPTTTVTASTSAPVTIDSGMGVPIDPNGVIGDVLSVRSMDLSILYANGVDYAIVSTGPYHTYGLSLLPVIANVTQVAISGNVLTAMCANDFLTGAVLTFSTMATATFLSGQTVTVASSNGTSFTAVYTYAGTYGPTQDTGTVTGYSIQDNQQVVVSYNKFDLNENLSFASAEVQTLNGTTYSTLANSGFVRNTWLPESWNRFGLTTDGSLVAAGVSHDSRYIKVMYNGTVMVENVDFVLNVNAVSGLASIARNLSGSVSPPTVTSRIPDGGAVLVSYFYTEVFDVATEFPSFVPILANQLASSKAAAASVIIKAMVANPIDITLAVSLSSGVSSSTMDPVIRTAIDRVLDNAPAGGTLYQSAIVSAIQAITGVQSVVIPLIKCAKSDGSYDIGVVIPTGTAWIPLGQDPLFSQYFGSSNALPVPSNSFISSSAVLPDLTFPSGGPPAAFVGLLYQGQEYSRAYSPLDFITRAAISPPISSSQNGFFYIIGSGDQIAWTATSGNQSIPLSGHQQRVVITIPADTSTPSLRSYFVTYTVEGEGSAKDVTLSSTEYFTPGRVTILYE